MALMHRYLVDERKWLDERQFLNALSFCMLLPGPEAMQLATYSGWRFHGVRGGLAAGLLFVLPGAIVVMALALLYLSYGALPLMEALFLGIKAAVLVIVAQALWKIANKALRRPADWTLAGLAFAALFLFGVPFPLIVLLAGLYGYFLAPHEDMEAVDIAAPVNLSQTGRTIAIWLAVWIAPLLLVAALFRGTPVFSEIAVLFSQLAVVTFGGAYAVLTYLMELTVARDWLSRPEMIDGLGLAETTPGPLILVTEFVAVIAAAREAGGIGWGILGGLVCLWATFAPCFLWVFAGAPYIERLDSMPRLRAALSAITASVVGVILNLALIFGLFVLFGTVNEVAPGPLHLLMPALSTIQPIVLALTAAAAFMLFGLRWSVPLVVGVMALLGWLVSGMPI